MSSFERSLRVVTAEPVGLVRATACAGVVLLASWSSWFGLARVHVYETSRSARIEYARAARPVEVPVTGRVVEEQLRLGSQVQSGQLLLALDTSLERKRSSEEQVRLVGLGPQRDALLRQATSEQHQLEMQRAAGRSAIEQARAQAEQASVQARYARLRFESLTRTDGAVARLEVLRVESEHEQARAAEAASNAQLSKTTRDQSVAESAALARIAELSRRLAEVESALSGSAAARSVIEQEIELRSVRAPCSGELGETASLRPGAVVQQGQRIATILGSGELHVVASFEPARVAGKLRAGQPARLRLDSFPFAQYGSLDARIANVASEVREGLLRVELSLSAHDHRIPVQHGLTGSVEVEVDEVAPVTLALRAAGRWVSQPSAAGER